MKRKVNAIWIGDGADGNGVLSAQSGAFEKMPYSFKTRFKNDDGILGTNPEELIAAAHAGCFNMKLSFVLNESNFSPEELNTDAVLTFEDGKIIEVIEMPVMTEGKKNKKQVNGAQIYNEFLKKINNKCDEIRVVIEQVSAMPGQGVTSMFNFGQSYGILKGICSAMQLPMFFVRPAKWKKYFNLINSQKDASRTRAIEIFPYFSTQLSKKKDSNKADAILIASFYYETHQKED